MELVACKTNGLCIKAMFGKELEAWKGKKITLFQGQWNGEECIRIWGSPDIEKQFDVSIELPRRKPFPMTMHKMSAKKDAAPVPTGVDPRIETAWGILEMADGPGDMASFQGTSAQYLAHLNGLIDERDNAA
jgi:hypothetical protein